MIWLTWRQFRSQAVSSLAVLAAFAILLGATGPHLANLYAGSGVASCHGQGCQNPANAFLDQVSGVYSLVFTLGLAAVILAPAVIGIFWGAPLIAREFETGTFRLAWTQGVTRGPVDGRQARTAGPDSHRRDRGTQPHVRLVGGTDRRGGPP